MHEKLTNFVVQHPVVGGLAFIAVGMVMIGESIEDAKQFHEFEHAREVSAQVVSVSGPTFRPLGFDVNVSWTEKGADVDGVVRVGSRDELKEGDSVQILIGESGRSVIPVSQRPKERPVRVAGLEATDLTFIGILMSFSGAMVAMFGKRIF